MVRKKKKAFPYKRYAAVAAAVLVLAAGGWFWRAQHNKSATDAAGNASKLTKTANGEINLNPATAQDQQDSDNHKDAAVAQDKAASSGSQSANVTPVISSAASDGVYAYVPGIFEDGGTCTATFTQGVQTFTMNSAGFKDATHTTCTPFSSIPFPNSGQWSVKVSYSSDSHHGESSVVSVK